jgi:KRAB domain-containing zinc finger protein
VRWDENGESKWYRATVVAHDAGAGVHTLRYEGGGETEEVNLGATADEKVSWRKVEAAAACSAPSRAGVAAIASLPSVLPGGYLPPTAGDRLTVHFLGYGNCPILVVAQCTAFSVNYSEPNGGTNYSVQLLPERFVRGAAAMTVVGQWQRGWHDDGTGATEEGAAALRSHHQQHCGGGGGGGGGGGEARGSGKAPSSAAVAKLQRRANAGPLSAPKAARSLPAAPGSRRDHKCGQCPSAFGQASHLRTHVRTVHEQRKDHLCPQCHVAFGEAGTLTKHVRTVHEKRRDHLCPQCHVAFGKAANLRTHVRTVHEKRREHVCPTCAAAFGTASHVTKHVRAVHEQRKDHLCPQCDVAFGQAADLRRHQGSWKHTAKEALEALHKAKKAKK